MPFYSYLNITIYTFNDETFEISLYFDFFQLNSFKRGEES